MAVNKKEKVNRALDAASLGALGGSLYSVSKVDKDVNKYRMNHYAKNAVEGTRHPINYKHLQKHILKKGLKRMAVGAGLGAAAAGAGLGVKKLIDKKKSKNESLIETLNYHLYKLQEEGEIKRNAGVLAGAGALGAGAMKLGAKKMGKAAIGLGAFGAGVGAMKKGINAYKNRNY